MRAAARDHRPFALALLLAMALRVVVVIAFPPALVFSDGPTYLSFLDTLQPDPDRPVGYGLLLLWPLSWLSNTVLAVALVQHLLGLATAAVLYGALRHWGVGRWVATMASLPVLLDAMQLLLEQSVLSDVLFELLVVSAVAILGWRRRLSPAAALAAGVVFGLAVTVRVVGEVLVLPGVMFCLLAAPTWRQRLATAAALSVGFALPVGAYAAWYHAEHSRYAVTDVGGRALYLRTTGFVDCQRLTVPDFERVLCPPEPRGERFDPSYYAWTDDRTVPRLDLPPGTSPDSALHDFAVAAIRAQPTDYLAAAARDFALNFDLHRGDRFEFGTAGKWQFDRYLSFAPSTRTLAAYRDHGGSVLSPRQPYATAVTRYQSLGYLPGPILLGCLLLGLVASLGVGAARGSGLRARSLLLSATGTALLVVPDLTAAFTWRYQLPALALLPGAAALGYAAVLGRSSVAGTRATASTDWPNGGDHRRSSTRVTGTTTRS